MQCLTEEGKLLLIQVPGNLKFQKIDGSGNQDFTSLRTGSPDGSAQSASQEALSE